MPLYPSDFFISPGGSAIVYSDSAGTLASGYSDLSFTQITGSPVSPYTWLISLSSAAVTPTDLSALTFTNQTTNDEGSVWVTSSTPTIGPWNPVIPAGNTVSFISSQSTPSWKAIGGPGQSYLTMTSAGSLSVASNATVGGYGIITDGTSYSRIYFAPTSLAAAPSQIVDGYTLIYTPNGKLFFSFSSSPSSVISFGNVDQNSLPFFPGTMPGLATYTASTPGQQYLTCYMLNLCALGLSSSF